MRVKRYIAMVCMQTGVGGTQLADAEPRSVVLATDFDALAKRLEEAELLLASSYHTKEHKQDCICTVCENIRTFLKARP